jgi:hypothetical protein
MILHRPIAAVLLAPLVLAGPVAAQPAEGAGALTPREEQVLKRIQELKGSAWRSFGACRYDWGSWRLSGGGVRVTLAECGDPPARSGVAVHCETLKVARRSGEDSWEAWRLPLSIKESKDLGGEDLMVASLCANLAAPSQAAPAQAAPKPAESKPAARPAGSDTAKPADAEDKKPAAPSNPSDKPADAKPSTPPAASGSAPKPTAPATPSSPQSQ